MKRTNEEYSGNGNGLHSSSSTPATAGLPQITCRVKRLSKNANLPTRGTPFAAGLDLYSAVDIILPTGGKTVAVATDIAISFNSQTPGGLYGRIAERSSMALKHIHLAGGVIDADYRGPIKVLLYNLGSEDYQIHMNDRIAQLILTPYIIPIIMECREELDQTERGEGGFGSTGVGSVSNGETRQIIEDYRIGMTRPQYIYKGGPLILKEEMNPIERPKYIMDLESDGPLLMLHTTHNRGEDCDECCKTYQTVSDKTDFPSNMPEGYTVYQLYEPVPETIRLVEAEEQNRQDHEEEGDEDDDINRC